MNAVAPANRLTFAQSNGTPAALALQAFDVIQSGFFRCIPIRQAQYDSLQVAFRTRFNVIPSSGDPQFKIFPTHPCISATGGIVVIVQFKSRVRVGHQPAVAANDHTCHLAKYELVRSACGWKGLGVNITVELPYPTIEGYRMLTILRESETAQEHRGRT